MSNSSTALSAHLRYLQIGSPDPAALARFYSTALGAQVTQVGEDWLCDGPQRHLIFSPGAANKLLAAGYEAPNTATLESLAQRLQLAGVAVERHATPFFQQGAVTFRDPDQNQISFGIAAKINDDVSGLPARLQHAVVASRNAERLMRFYIDVVGMRISDEVRTDAGDLSTCFLHTDHEHHSFAVFQASEDRLDHHCYESSDWNAIRDWSDRFSAQGLILKWGPGRHGPGNNLFIFIHDPDGNWVEISAELQQLTEPHQPGLWKQEERTLNQWGKALLRS